jgi:uncharacterized membrane protein YphA (DoxX/SURF4 family)
MPSKRKTPAKRMPPAGSPAIGLLFIRIFLGVFFLFEGWDKLPWLMHPEQLGAILHRWVEGGSPLSRWYLQTIAIPGVPVFARLIFMGEVLAGAALICGMWTRTAAVVAFLLVVNIHFAHNTLFQYSFLSKGDGLPVLGGLLALAIGGARLPLSLGRSK